MIPIEQLEDSIATFLNVIVFNVHRNSRAKKILLRLKGLVTSWNSTFHGCIQAIPDQWKGCRKGGIFFGWERVPSKIIGAREVSAAKWVTFIFFNSHLEKGKKSQMVYT